MAATQPELNFLRFHQQVLKPLAERSDGDPLAYDPLREMASAAGMIALNFVSLGVMWGYFSANLAARWNERYSIASSEFSVPLTALAVMDHVGTLFEISNSGRSFIIEIRADGIEFDTLDNHHKVSIDQASRLYEQTLIDETYLQLGAALNFSEDHEWSNYVDQASRSYETAVDDYPQLMTSASELSEALRPWWFFDGALHMEASRISAADSILGGLDDFLNYNRLTRADLVGDAAPSVHGAPSGRALTKLELDSALALAQPRLRVPSLDLRQTPVAEPGSKRPPRDVRRQLQDPDPLGTLPGLLSFPIEGTGTARGRQRDLETGAAMLGSLLKSQALQQLGWVPGSRDTEGSHSRISEGDDREVDPTGSGHASRRGG